MHLGFSEAIVQPRKVDYWAKVQYCRIQQLLLEKKAHEASLRGKGTIPYTEKLITCKTHSHNTINHEGHGSKEQVAKPAIQRILSTSSGPRSSKHSQITRPDYSGYLLKASIQNPSNFVQLMLSKFFHQSLQKVSLALFTQEGWYHPKQVCGVAICRHNKGRVALHFTAFAARRDASCKSNLCSKSSLSLVGHQYCSRHLPFYLPQLIHKSWEMTRFVRREMSHRHDQIQYLNQPCIPNSNNDFRRTMQQSNRNNPQLSSETPLSPSVASGGPI